MQYSIKSFFIISIILFGKNLLPAQSLLQPGFDAKEFADILQMDFVMMGDSLGAGAKYDLQKGSYVKQFSSPVVGLYNKCETYLRSDSTAFIVLRGTVGKPESWLENFYSGMAPANGTLQLNDSTKFDYHLSDNKEAYVHIGWLVGVGFLSPFITQQMDALMARGIRKVIVAGHSQGGALAFLTTSYIYYRYHQLFPDLQIKTYASGTPKPGNLYYAYDFDFITANGYGYRIVNSADWVPETPVTTQTLGDYNEVNPLKGARPLLKKQKKILLRLVLVHAYNKLNRRSNKAMRSYRKYLGDMAGKVIKKTLPQYAPPNYVQSMNYMPAGSPIILMADSTYHATFPFDGKNMFTHHMLKPYQYLLNKYYANKP